MSTLLIVEDDPSDLKSAAEMIGSLKFSDVQARTTGAAAKLYLEAALEGRESIPDVLIVDLDLGYDSGFELLRFWHSYEALSSKSRLIVWTALGEEQLELCRLFKVAAIVPKADGVAALKRAIHPFDVGVS